MLLALLLAAVPPLSLVSQTRTFANGLVVIVSSDHSAPGIAVEPTTGETHLRHHISPTGFYRGRKVLKTKADA